MESENYRMELFYGQLFLNSFILVKALIKLLVQQIKF